MKSNYYTCILTISLAAFITPNLVMAEECIVDPASTTLRQGETVEVYITSPTISEVKNFSVSLGNLPTFVEGGFINSENIKIVNGTTKIPVRLNALSRAQTGSFMVHVEYKTAENGILNTTSCQFNLRIEKNQNSTSNISSDYKLPKVVSSGTIPVSVNKDSKISNSASKRVGTSADKITANLKKKSQGEQVLVLQKILQKYKFFPADIVPTGYFGQITEDALKAFQQANNLDPVGVVGPKTRKLLNE